MTVLGPFLLSFFFLFLVLVGDVLHHLAGRAEACLPARYCFDSSFLYTIICFGDSLKMPSDIPSYVCLSSEFCLMFTHQPTCELRQEVFTLCIHFPCITDCYICDCCVGPLPTWSSFLFRGLQIFTNIGFVFLYP